MTGGWASAARAKYRAWRKYSFATRLLIVEAALWLGLYRLLILLVPFRWFAPRKAPLADRCEDTELPLRVGRAVLTASRHVPWQAACLAQALAAKTMLALRGTRSVMHLGARFDEDGELAAHAWLSCGDRLVTGGSGLAGYTPLISLG